MDVSKILNIPNYLLSATLVLNIVVPMIMIYLRKEHTSVLSLRLVTFVMGIWSTFTVTVAMLVVFSVTVVDIRFFGITALAVAVSMRLYASIYCFSIPYARASHAQQMKSLRREMKRNPMGL
jgi:hypothetical protein